MSVVPDNPVDRDEYPNFFHPLAQFVKGFFEGRKVACPISNKTKRLSDLVCDGLWSLIDRYRLDEWKGFLAAVDCVLAHPCLSPLHRVNRLQQVWTCSFDRLIGNGSEVLDWNVFLWRFVKEEQS